MSGLWLEIYKSVGGGWLFELFRCVKCDSTKEVECKVSNEGERTIPSDIRCRRCGDEMRDDLNVMCPFCHSRSNEQEDVLVFYDW